MMIQTLDQKRAADACRKVEQVRESHNADWQNNYVSYVKSLPAAILNCGLGQAAATIRTI
jgi:CRISPR type III-B/RAMP module-associated protein Cmr5